MFTLNWQSILTKRVQSTGNLLLKYFGIFTFIRHTLNKKNARRLNFAILISRIKYGIGLHGNCLGRNMNKTQSLQNNSLQSFLQVTRLTPTNTLYKNLSILKINHLYKHCILSFVSDTQIGKYPKMVINIFRKKRNNYDLYHWRQLNVPLSD